MSQIPWLPPRLQAPISQSFITMGRYIFGLFFIFNFGVYLGGDPYYLGFFVPDLIIEFPFFAFGLLLVFFGKSLRIPSSQNWQSKDGMKKLFRRENALDNRLLGAIFFLIFLGFSSAYAVDPEISFFWLILWSLGFFALGIGNTFSLDVARNRKLFSWGLFFGCIGCLFGFHQAISLELLSFMAFLLLVWDRKKKDLSPLKIIFYTFLTAASFNFWFLIFIFLFWNFPKLWLSPLTIHSEAKVHKILPSLLLLLILIWGSFFFDMFFPATLSSGEVEFFRPLFSDEKSFFFGSGSGQFLMSLPDFSTHFLLPQNFIQPQFGISLTFFEGGILGVLAIFLLALFPVFQSKKNTFLASNFLIGWFFFPDFLGSEGGIFLALVLLFSGEN